MTALSHYVSPSLNFSLFLLFRDACEKEKETNFEITIDNRLIKQLNNNKENKQCKKLINSIK